jgi:hypothetical protein
VQSGICHRLYIEASTIGDRERRGVGCPCEDGSEETGRSGLLRPPWPSTTRAIAFPGQPSYQLSIQDPSHDVKPRLRSVSTKEAMLSSPCPDVRARRKGPIGDSRPQLNTSPPIAAPELKAWLHIRPIIVMSIELVKIKVYDFGRLAWFEPECDSKGWRAVAVSLDNLMDYTAGPAGDRPRDEGGRVAVGGVLRGRDRGAGNEEGCLRQVGNGPGEGDGVHRHTGLRWGRTIHPGVTTWELGITHSGRERAKPGNLAGPCPCRPYRAAMGGCDPSPRALV